MKTTVIGIYETQTDLIAHIVDTIQEGAEWIGCGVTTLYDSLHRDGTMNAKGYYLERVTINENTEDQPDGNY